MRKTKARHKTKAVTLSALFTALICIFSQISFLTPLGLPVTLQTLAIALCGYTLGWKYGLCSVLSYILLALAGLPVLSGFKGGIYAVFGPTGGFLAGFVLLTLLCGLSEALKSRISRVLLGLAGILLCHLAGIIWFSYSTGVGIYEALFTCSLSFIPKDIISLLAAAHLSAVIKKRLN